MQRQSMNACCKLFRQQGIELPMALNQRLPLKSGRDQCDLEMRFAILRHIVPVGFIRHFEERGAEGLLQQVFYTLFSFHGCFELESLSIVITMQHTDSGINGHFVCQST